MEVRIVIASVCSYWLMFSLGSTRISPPCIIESYGFSHLIPMPFRSWNPSCWFLSIVSACLDNDVSGCCPLCLIFHCICVMCKWAIVYAPLGKPCINHSISWKKALPINFSSHPDMKSLTYTLLKQFYAHIINGTIVQFTFCYLLQCLMGDFIKCDTEVEVHYVHNIPTFN